MNREELKQQAIITLKTCKDCGQEFQSESYRLFEINICMDNGRCPECKHKAQVALEEKRKTEWLAEIARVRRIWRESCGIDERYMKAEFGNYEQKRQPAPFKKCLEYADNFPIASPKGYKSLLLFSEKSWGTGKTHLACAIAHKILNRWNGENYYRNEHQEVVMPNLVQFITEPDLFNSLRATFNYTQEQKQQLPSADVILTRLIRVPLLILDDLGKETNSDPAFRKKTLFTLIDGRYRKTLPMVITSNLNASELREHLGKTEENEASFERILEMCGGKFVQMEGQSYRRKNTQG